MRNFWLKRIEDESGVSGVGVVAEGTQFDNGKCVLAWVTQFQSIAVYDSIEELERIHGHNGKTVVVWAQPTMRAADVCHEGGLHEWCTDWDKDPAMEYCAKCGTRR